MQSILEDFIKLLNVKRNEYDEAKNAHEVDSPYYHYCRGKIDMIDEIIGHFGGVLPNNNIKNSINMEKALEIPRITNTTLQYFVDGEYVDNVDINEVNKIRENILEQIVATQDASILDRFYFVGHKDANSSKMGEEIKITMDSFGDLSDLPWEMAHVRRSMYHLIEIGRKHSELLYRFTHD